MDDLKPGREFGKEIMNHLAPEIRQVMEAIPVSVLKDLEEIRLRAFSPVLLRCRNEDSYLSPQGTLTGNRGEAFICPPELIKKTVLMLCGSSLYSVEEELQKGFLTLPGGHRVGFTGKAVLEAGHLKMLKQISSLNIRVARFVPGAADGVLKFLIDGSRVYHTLFISPPRSGKTTVLRDLIQKISDGFGSFHPLNVGIVDERSEIAGCREGIPQLPVGHCSDVLDGCPKAEGMMMLVRAMGPDVIATDEIGRPEDAAAVQEVINAGISLLATCHGQNLADVTARPGTGNIIKQKFFDRYVVLSRRRGPGTVESVHNKDWFTLWKG